MNNHFVSDDARKMMFDACAALGIAVPSDDELLLDPFARILAELARRAAEK